MTATLMDVLMILALGILAGTGSGLLAGFIAGKQEREWRQMNKKQRLIALVLAAACSASASGILAWFIFRYTAV